MAAVATLVCAATPASASASIPCRVAGDTSGLLGKACDLASNPKQLLSLGKNLVTGHLGSVLNELLGGGGPSGASVVLSLAAIGTWIIGGAKAAVTWMVKAIQASAAPQLGAVWFSSTYWRVAAIAALLTLPFLFAAAVQALLRSDLSILTRAAFGHLPLAMLCVGIAAPLTMLLLASTDELCSLVWSPSASHGLISLLRIGGGVFGIAALKSRFLGFLFGLLTAGAAVAVWLELLMREAAVYVVVLLLPLAFAAIVWPARRIWALRAAELLVALILSKFAIVAVLGLGGMALNHAGSHGVGAVIAGVVLVILAAFAPWAVLRLVPLSEVASGAASALRSHARAPFSAAWSASERVERNTNAVLDNLAAQVALATGASNGASPLANGKSVPPAGRAHSPADRQADAADQSEDLLGVSPGTFDGDLAGQDGGHPADGGGAASENIAATETGLGVADTGLGITETGWGITDRAATGERVPGAAPMWQAPDMSWRPLTLGMDEGWPPPPLWTEGGEGDAGSGGGAPPDGEAGVPPVGGDGGASPLTPPEPPSQ